MADQNPYADVTPADSPKSFDDIVADAEFIKLAFPLVNEGDPCVDFDLPVYDFSSGSAVPTDSSFHLVEQSANQPVALIFGSYT
jgi:hypothetical protein